jgi:predicted dehydrogenase
MSSKVRWGILSTASHGLERVVPKMIESSSGEVVAIASRHLDRATEAAGQLGIPTAYGSYEELLADADVDAVYNPLPTALHAEWGVRCAEAGKPMLCEKPLADTYDNARRMVDAFGSRDLLFAEALMYRHHPLTRKIKSMVDEGVVGKVNLLKGQFSVPLDAENDFRFRKALGGGSLLDLGSYIVSAFRLMVGEEPVNVTASAATNDDGVDTMLTATLEFPGGALGFLGCSMLTQFDCSYQLGGTEGRIVTDAGTVPNDEGPDDIRWWQGWYDEKEPITIPATNHYALMVRDFEAALLEGRAPLVDPDDSLNNMKVLDRIHAAAGITR